MLSSGGTLRSMNTTNPPNVKFVQTPDYRETYSNSVQIRVNVWDFFLVFGTMQQSSETQVDLRNFQGIYLSPVSYTHLEVYRLKRAQGKKQKSRAPKNSPIRCGAGAPPAKIRIEKRGCRAPVSPSFNPQKTSRPKGTLGTAAFDPRSIRMIPGPTLGSGLPNRSRQRNRAPDR